MFTAGRILRNLNRGDAGPVNSVLISQPKKRMKDKRKFRCYVPFVWQALMATCVGFFVMLIGITLCVVGYYADHIQSLTAPRRLDNVTSTLSLVREKYATEGKTEEGAGSGARGESAAGSGYNYLKCMIYIGPALMSCGSFAIVFSCVVVCETRDKLLEFMDEREKANLPRKASLKFDFFRSMVSPTSAGRRRPNNTSCIDVFPSTTDPEGPKPIRPASLSVTEFDAGQKRRLLLSGTEADDRFSGRTENDRFGSNMGYNDEGVGTGLESAGQGPVHHPVSSNQKPDSGRFSTSCRTDTDRLSADIGYFADYLGADQRSELDRDSVAQNHRPLGETVEQRTASPVAPGSCLSVITAPIDRSLRGLPQSTGHDGRLVTASALATRDRDRRSLDGSLSGGWRADSIGRRGRRRRSGSPDIACRPEAAHHASEKEVLWETTARSPDHYGQRQMTLLKTDEDENRTIAQRLTEGPDGLRRGPIERPGTGSVQGPCKSYSPAEDSHHHHQLLEVSRETVDSSKASGVASRQSPPGVASCRLTSGSLQSISGAIVQFRPQALAGQRSVHIIHKAHVHQEPRPTFSTMPQRFSQQKLDQQDLVSFPFSVSLTPSTANE